MLEALPRTESRDQRRAGIHNLGPQGTDSSWGFVSYQVENAFTKESGTPGIVTMDVSFKSLVLY